MSEFLEQLDKKVFIRVHRSYVVNIKMVDNVFPAEVSVKGKKVSIGKNYKDDLMKILGIN